MHNVKVFNFKKSVWTDSASDVVPFGTGLPQKITPQQAAIMLRKNHNRAIKPNKVNKIARDLKKDEFDVSNDMISFSSDGVVLNGQHRLKAIEQTGIAASCFVGYGFTKDQQTKMDEGSKRDLYDVSVLDGITIDKKMASIARFVRCQTIQGNFSRQTTRAEELDFIRSHIDDLQAASDVLSATGIAKHDRIKFTMGNDIGSAFFRALTFYKNSKPQLKEVKRFVRALLSEKAAAKMSILVDSKSSSTEERNRALLVRHYKSFIEESKQLRRSGQDQGGRDYKYRMTERYISEFVNPKSTLMKRKISHKIENSEELFKLTEELS